MSRDDAVRPKSGVAFAVRVIADQGDVSFAVGSIPRRASHDDLAVGLQSQGIVLGMIQDRRVYDAADAKGGIQ